MVYCYYQYGRRYCRNNRWSSWGRWVLLGVILVAAILFFLLFACISARRRRKLGNKPFMGTGWTAPNHGPVTYNSPSQYKSEQPVTGHTNQNHYNNNTTANQSYGQGQNASYYGGQNYNDPTQQGYQPPAYPPPAANRV